MYHIVHGWYKKSEGVSSVEDIIKSDRLRSERRKLYQEALSTRLYNFLNEEKGSVHELWISFRDSIVNTREE